MSWVIVVDIGNTSASFGLARGTALKCVRRIDGYLSKKNEIASALEEISKGHSIVGSVLCSVVPAANMAWVSALKKQLGVYPIVVNHRHNLGINITYPKPASIGADRLANACGAAHKYGTPSIVADFGTALTFDVICTNQGYVGGVIAPGLPLMTDYLADKTALLPHIELKGTVQPLGKSTEGAMRLGAQVGYRGIVREIVNHLKEVIGEKEIILCATGGYARWALKGIDMDFHFDPSLTLYGLSRIYDLNS